MNNTITIYTVKFNPLVFFFFRYTLKIYVRHMQLNKVFGN